MNKRTDLVEGHGAPLPEENSPGPQWPRGSTGIVRDTSNPTYEAPASKVPPFGPHRWGDGEGAQRVVEIPAGAEPLDIRALMGSCGPSAVEIGPGRGYFLMAMARTQPLVTFLGLEYKAKRVWKIARRLHRAGIANASVAWVDANAVIGRLTPGSVDAFYINFPDPWPKRRHHKKRLIQPVLTAALSAALAPGGSLTVATDHASYAAQILAALEATPGLANTMGPRGVAGQIDGYPVDAFEEQFRRQGLPLFFMRYVKVSGNPPGRPMP